MARGATAAAAAAAGGSPRLTLPEDAAAGPRCGRVRPDRPLLPEPRRRLGRRISNTRERRVKHADLLGGEQLPDERQDCGVGDERVEGVGHVTRLRALPAPVLPDRPAVPAGAEQAVVVREGALLLKDGGTHGRDLCGREDAPDGAKSRVLELADELLELLVVVAPLG
eukprot:SAG22_NODE_554_length_9135_cov_3.635569_5_plen_168_part_00